MVNRYLDIETQGLDARKFVLGMIITEDNREKSFTSSRNMREWIFNDIEIQLRNKKRVYYYAHNHEFDFYGYIGDMVFDKDMKIYTTNPLIACYKSKAWFLDSMAFYRMSLKKVGDIIGLEKMNTPESLINGDDNVSILEIIPYLRRDVLIVKKAMEDFKTQIKGLGFSPRFMISSGQVGMTAFKTYIQKNNLHWDLGYLSENEYGGKKFVFNPTKYDIEIRSAFRGGRVEAFKTGKFDKAWGYDINSQHPYVEINMDFPNLKTEKYISNPTHLSNKVGVSKVSIYSPRKTNLSIAYLPIFWEDKQIYPHDCIMTGVWTNYELNKAVSLGYKINKIFWTVDYETAKNNPLKDYQMEMWKIRKSNPDMKMAIKLLMNSFGMKFAQTNSNKDLIICYRNECTINKEKGFRFKGTYKNKYIMEKTNKDWHPDYYAPIISTYITALARDMLYDCIDENTIYCDTDSIISNKKRTNLNIGDDIGQWKIEHEGVECHVLGEKRYYIGEKIALSGLSSKERDKIMIDEQLTTRVKRMVSYKQAISKGDMNLMGSFEEHDIRIEYGSKKDIEYPKEIVENYYEENKGNF